MGNSYVSGSYEAGDFDFEVEELLVMVEEHSVESDKIIEEMMLIECWGGMAEVRLYCTHDIVAVAIIQAD